MSRCKSCRYRISDDVCRLGFNIALDKINVMIQNSKRKIETVRRENA